MNTKTALYKVYWAMRARIAPSLRYSQDIYEAILRPYVTADTTWLDLGCGHHVLPTWRSADEERLVAQCRAIIGVDQDFPSLAKHRSITHRVAADLTRLPIADTSFDLVTANMVVEHLDNPQVQFLEVGRVLRPGGVFLFHTPNALSHFTILSRITPRRLKLPFVHFLDGRSSADIFPAYYLANSRSRIERLANSTGLQIERFELIATDAMFAPIPPLALLELIWLRILLTRYFKALRTNIITVMRKPKRLTSTDARSGPRETPHRHIEA